jgi:hypothetical protein
MSTAHALSDVPYISPWTGERTFSPPLVPHPHRSGIAYAGEHVMDRDRYGVLWELRAFARGHGTPLLGQIHPQRQRITMGGMACQWCKNPAHVTEQGTLFVLDSPTGDDLPEGVVTAQPPVCLRCAPRAVDRCPVLRHGHSAALVRRADVEGVYGRVYTPTLDTYQRAYVPYGDPRIPWTLAGQLYARLHGCTPVNLGELTAEASR